MELGALDAWSRNSLDVEALEDAISRLPLFGGEREFNVLLQTQVANCDRFYNAVITELILKNSADQGRMTEALALKLASEIIRLDEFGNTNAMHLVNIVKMHDEESKFSMLPSYQWKFQRTDFCPPEALDPLLLRLSSQYVMLRELKEAPLAPREALPSVFEHRSVKFWVRVEHVVKAVCEIVKHIPIENSGVPGRMSQQTSALYYDDDQLSLYASSLVKEDNSSLIRFRWNGELTKDTEVTVERKVHHEQWTPRGTHDSSFTLREENVHGFVVGNHQPTADFLAKHPSFVEIQQMVINDGLHPCLTTRFNRALFKSSDDSVRMSLDSNLLMFRESNVELASTWRRRDNNYAETTEVHRFPFAVLEIKIRGNLMANPVWVDQIMNNTRALIRVEQFSKYGHGVAMLYKKEVKALPYWLDENFMNNKDNDNPDDDPLLPEPQENKELQTEGKTSRGNLSLYTHATNTLKKHDLNQRRAKRKNPVSVSAWRTCCNYLTLSCCCCNRANKAKQEARMRIEPKTFFANERTYLQWFMTAVFIGVVSVGYIVVNTEPSLTLGRALLPLAGLIALYSIVLYHWRTEMLMRRQPSATYADRWGPTVLTVIFIVIICYSIAISAAPLPTVVIEDKVKPVSRLEAMITRCAVPVALSNPPEGKFVPTGMAYLGSKLYIADRAGRLGSLEGGSFHVLRAMSLPPLGPMLLGGLANLPPKDGVPVKDVLYAVRQMPLAILEINATTGLPTRTFEMGGRDDFSGLAIVPTADDYLVYTSATDGSLSTLTLPLVNTSLDISPSNRLDPNHVGFVSEVFTASAPILMYRDNHLYAHFNNITKVYAINASTGEAKLVGGHSFAMPSVRAFAVGPGEAFVASSNEQLIRMQFDTEDGFASC